ncbi:hypothetical protein GDO81_011986 [Engystomops pustulosus]|uniref:Uncharacterized protein n=1 Tax=Engystomops pustulosus TaxID=76066 RepID=A0AAV7BHY8_ENGPU|nr:hypothetical protein GDO81_011986 [Engystomops pustulosus]
MGWNGLYPVLQPSACSVPYCLLDLVFVIATCNLFLTLTLDSGLHLVIHLSLAPDLYQPLPVELSLSAASLLAKRPAGPWQQNPFSFAVG